MGRLVSNQRPLACEASGSVWLGVEIEKWRKDYDSRVASTLRSTLPRSADEMGQF